MARSRNAVAVQNPESAESVHEVMFRTLLKTPHRNYDETLHIHIDQFNKDPNFYAKLACWALNGNNVVRDINEIFLAVLFNSPYQEHKDAAYVYLQELPPYQVVRVGNLFTGYYEIISSMSYESPPRTDNQLGITVKPQGTFKRLSTTPSVRKAKIPKKIKSDLVKQGKISNSDKEFTVSKFRVHHNCLGNRRYKGTFRDAVRSFLKIHEKDTRFMESAIVRSKDKIKRLYCKTNTLPQNNENGWINQFLFHNIVPPDSKIEHLRKLSKSEDPIEQAKIISEHKIPYPIAVASIKNITPSILVSLINVMSPQELMSNLASLQRRGAMDNNEIKGLIENKLNKAQKSNRVDAMKGSAAVAAVENLDKDIREAAIKVTDNQLKKYGQIKLKTCIMIDKSGSMTSAIEIGKIISAAIAQSCAPGNDPYVYLFDSNPIPIIWNESDGNIGLKSSWDKKLETFRANGGTLPSTVIKAMISKNIKVDQIVIITDEGENSGPSMSSALVEYQKTFDFIPSLIFVRVGNYDTRMEDACKKINATVDAFTASTIDSVSLPNLIQLLTKKSVFDLIQDILAISLPSRQKFDMLHSLA